MRRRYDSPTRRAEPNVRRLFGRAPRAHCESGSPPLKRLRRFAGGLRQNHQGPGFVPRKVDRGELLAGDGRSALSGLAAARSRSRRPVCESYRGNTIADLAPAPLSDPYEASIQRARPPVEVSQPALSNACAPRRHTRRRGCQPIKLQIHLLAPS